MTVKMKTLQRGELSSSLGTRIYIDFLLLVSTPQDSDQLNDKYYCRHPSPLSSSQFHECTNYVDGTCTWIEWKAQEWSVEKSTVAHAVRHPSGINTRSGSIYKTCIRIGVSEGLVGDHSCIYLSIELIANSPQQKLWISTGHDAVMNTWRALEKKKTGS